MDNVPEKRCASCKASKPCSEFHRNHQQKDGLSPYCRGCANARSVAAYYAHRTERTAYQRAYRARMWGQRTEAQRAHRRAWERQYRPRQRAQSAALQRDWRARHRAERAQYRRAWVAAHRAVVQEANRRRVVRRRGATIGTFTVAQLEAKLAYWGRQCWVCGGAAEAVDHVKPLARGGPHCLANLRPICDRCNLAKHAIWPYPLVYERLGRRPGG